MTAYDLRISDWSSDVCSSDLKHRPCPSQPRLRTLCPLRTHAPAAGAHAVMPARSDLPRFPMKARLRKSSVLLALCLRPLAGCRDDAPQALGTLEYDRVTLPAPVAERIVSIDVREGQRVEAGAALLTLETTRTEAQAQAAQAQARRLREALAELQAETGRAHV